MVSGSALLALETLTNTEKVEPGSDKWVDRIYNLMEEVDSYIPTPERETDKPFLMATEDVFSITGRGTVATGRIERGQVNVGDTVIWINNGGNHDVNGNISAITGEPYNNPESFDSDNNNVEGEIIYSHVFNVPGEYNYDCSVGNHALQGMVGTINVVYSSVYEIIEQSADHDTLEIAILEAELDGALSGDGTFTVFAPTDAAFALIDPAIFQAILSDNAILTSVLLHHVHNEATVLSTSSVSYTHLTLPTKA